jgi:hypothetical protein
MSDYNPDVSMLPAEGEYQKANNLRLAKTNLLKHCPNIVKMRSLIARTRSKNVLNL